ncbi:SRPBCC domain-containing protein [Phytoactinopolyspora limicola]|uniref:SRPBCC domain-containing protein n=1 Tax=Phytoactinopolyspora limicola TaxID=2715536 RepID=UPI0014085174|nr:SRPBCC domain-containing protein [Phytoactinopolyspora limicola]
MQNTIDREIIVRAPLTRVWSVVTQPTYVSRWFGQHAEFELREGAPAQFGWDDYGSFAARIERVEAPHKFSFRWAEDPDTSLDDGPSTLVEFTLTAVDQHSTKVHVVESGFADFPAARIRAAIDEHVHGWQVELDHLVAFLQELDGVATS